MKGSIFAKIVSSIYGKNKPRAINDDYNKVCENCEVRRITKSSISLDDRAASIHTCRFISLFLSFPFILVSSLSRMIIVPMRFMPSHAGNTDVPLCNRSLIVSWLIALYRDDICIIQGVQKKKLCGNSNQCNAIRMYVRQLSK